MDYAEIYGRLNFETAIIVFLKKSGDIRTMLATRCTSTIDLNNGDRGVTFGGYDKRCTINNGNIAVIDLVIGEARQFNVERLLKVQFIGEIKTQEQMDNAMEQFYVFKSHYEKSESMTLDMGTLDQLPAQGVEPVLTEQTSVDDIFNFNSQGPLGNFGLEDL